MLNTVSASSHLPRPSCGSHCHQLHVFFNTPVSAAQAVSVEWDGLDAKGTRLLETEDDTSAYEFRWIDTSAVSYEWQGVIGNTGPSSRA